MISFGGPESENEIGTIGENDENKLAEQANLKPMNEDVHLHSHSLNGPIHCCGDPGVGCCR